jgi:hypothetical protein
MDGQKGSDLEKSIARLDAAAIVALTQPSGGRTVEEVIDALWKSESLLDKQGSKSNWSTRRKAFIEQLHEAFASSAAASAASLKTLAQVLETTDANFAKILEQTGKSAGAALPPLTQAAAATAFACQMLTKLEQASREAMGEGPEFVVRNNFMIEGLSVNPDAAMFGVLKAMGSTILLLAFRNGWLNADGEVVLPHALQRPSDKDIEEVQSVLSFAAAWHSWERAQLRTRLAHLPFKYLQPPFPTPVPASITSIIHVQPDHDVELVDFIANERLLTRTNQQYFEMLEIVNLRQEPSLDVRTPLAPNGFVSFEEAHGLHTLYEYYAYDVHRDSTSYAGLTLMEWLRAYAILRRLAAELVPAATEHPCPQLTEIEIVAYLTRGGLSDASARRFIGHCCLTSRRSDIYDRPLVRVGSDRYLFVAPSQRNGILGPIIVSALNGAGATVERKGKAFEKRLREDVKGKDRKITAFTKKRDNEEYDYDALMVWGDYCFLFECKNHTLSGGVIQLAHHALQENVGHAKQVRRLIDGILKHPDMLDDLLPEARGKLLVPCVVNNLQYSVPSGINGVFFADSSAIRRFFANPVIGQIGARAGQAPARIAGGDIARLWAGESPTPLEFLRHLYCPLQFITANERTECPPILSGISEHEAFIMHDYRSLDLDIDSGREAAAKYDSTVPLMSDAEWELRLPRIP